MKPSVRVITFIETSVNGAKLRRGMRAEYRVQDTRRQMMAGLVLDVLPGGKKVWRCHYDVRQDGKRIRRKVKLGTHCTSLATIREAWQKIRDTVDSERDYVAELKEQRQQDEIDAKRRITFAAFAAKYLADHEGKKRTWKDDVYRLDKYILPEIGDMALGAVQRQDVRRLIKPIAVNAPTQADRVKQVISSVYNYYNSAVDEDDHKLVNPAKGIAAYQTGEKQREPVPPAALAVLWPILEREDVTLDRWRSSMVARIAFLTGLRISEVIGAQRDELGDLDALKPIWKLKEERTGRKRKRRHSVPLTPRLQDLFRQALARSEHPTEVFFPTLVEDEGYKKVWYHVHDCAYVEAGIQPGIGLHSIRHFATTQMAYMGVEREWRDRVTDHVGPHTRGEDKRYNHFDFYDQKLRALQMLDKRVTQLAVGEAAAGNVVALETTAR